MSGIKQAYPQTPFYSCRANASIIVCSSSSQRRSVVVTSQLKANLKYAAVFWFAFYDTSIEMYCLLILDDATNIHLIKMVGLVILYVLLIVYK